MADDTKNATSRGRVQPGSRAGVAQSRVVMQTYTVEAAAAASAGSTYTLARIPTSARLMGLSRMSFDDLASTGAPTIDVGLRAVDANFTTDVDCINDGTDVFTAASSVPLIKDIANYGKMVWEFTAQTSDPRGFADLILTILDAGVNTGGTITVELVMVTDS